jgi:hypothetical protein
LAKKTVDKQPREYTKRQISHAKKQQMRQRIYLFSGIGVIIAVILLTLSGWIFGEFIPLHKTVIKIYDTTISEGDVIDSLVAYGSMQTGLDIEQNIDAIISAMVQNELIRKVAAELGITVSDQEVSDAVKGTKVSKGYQDIVRASLLTEKLKKEYFNKQVPDSGNQVLMNTMMVESEALASEIRAKLLSGDNFSMLAEKYALDTASKNNKGVFDWHPQSILESSIGNTISTKWAFSESVTKGDISSALSDNATDKQVGYWLIKLDGKPVNDGEETSANVSALLLSSLDEAIRVKAQLEAGDNLSMLAEKLSQYTPSKDGRGQMTVVQSENISAVVNGYIFNENTRLAQWSEPLKDTQQTTKGSAWIVQLVDKSNDRPYSTDDKNTLVDNVYSAWASKIFTSASSDVEYTFDDSQRAMALDRANRKLK